MIWTGPADFSNAISQLLNDLTWRDTKGTLLLFIRNLDRQMTQATATTSSCTPTATRTRNCT